MRCSGAWSERRHVRTGMEEREMSSHDRKQPRFSRVTFTIGGGREPSLRRDVIVAVLLDVIVLARFGGLGFQQTRASDFTFLTEATQVLLVIYTQVPLWWRVYVKLRRGEDAESWALPPMSSRVLRWWLTVPVVLLGGHTILVGMELAKGLQAGQPDWLGIGVVAAVLWLLRGLALAQVVGLPQRDGSAEEYGDAMGSMGRSEGGAERPDSV